MSAVAAAPATGRTRRLSRWRSLSTVQSVQVALLTVAGITGAAGVLTYVFHEDLLAPYPGVTPFAFNVGLAICAITAGVILDGHRASRALGVFVAVLGALTLVEHISGTDLGIGRVLFDPFRETSVGRMAPNTAVCVTFAGVALATRGRVSTVLAAIPALIGLMAALGYTDPDAKALASIGQSVNMALPTAVGLCTSSLALVLARERGFFTRPTGGGTIIRRLGPDGAAAAGPRRLGPGGRHPQRRVLGRDGHLAADRGRRAVRARRPVLGGQRGRPRGGAHALHAGAADRDRGQPDRGPVPAA